MLAKLRFILIVLLLNACAQTPITLTTEAINQRYYVAPNGNNTNPGTLSQPFRTIQKCASLATPGTACLIRAGTYRETVKPPVSGAAGLPIVFMPYNKESVIVSGTNLVENWTLYKDSIYKAAVSWDLGLGNNQVFVNGKMMLEARYPNGSTNLMEPWLGKFLNPLGSNVTYTVSAANLPSDLINANINFIPGPQWVVETGKITAATPNSFRFSSANGQLTERPSFNPNLYVPRNGNPYFIWGKFSLLDSPGEWFLDPNEGQIYFGELNHTQPNLQTVEVKRRMYAFDLTDRSFIVIRGILVFAATITTADINKNPDTALSRNIFLSDIHVRYPSHFTFVKPGTSWLEGMNTTGIILFGQNHRLENSSISFSAGNGVSLAGTKHKIRNNIIHDINYAVTDSSAIVTGYYGYASRSHLIQNNTLYNTGRSSIVHRNTRALKILNNHLYNSGLLANDLGMTYTYESDGAGTEIAYNLIHDNFAPGESMGIYLDNGSKNFIVHHNIVYNVRNAVTINLPTLNNKIYNNTLLGFYESMFSGAGVVSDCNATGTVVINNIFNAKLNLGVVFDGTKCLSEKAFPKLENNLDSTLDPKFVDLLTANFSLGTKSPALNTGRVLVPYTNAYIGSAPDLGALESGLSPFSAGATITEPCVYRDSCLAESQIRYGVKAEYFADEQLSSLRSQRIEASFDFGYFSENDIPSGSFLTSGKNYSARWTAYLRAPVTANYTFTLTADDGARMWFNNIQRINRWDYADPPINTFRVFLQAGEVYPIKQEMHQNSGGAAAILEWSYPGQPKQKIPLEFLTLDRP